MESISQEGVKAPQIAWKAEVIEITNGTEGIYKMSITNGEKYKTAQERAEAFRRWYVNACHAKDDYVSENDCFEWLDLDAEEDKYHCIFCGKELKYKFDGEFGGKLVCECGCEEPHFDRVEESIAAHNRVAKKCEGKEC